jgi:hypothetical protein
MRASTYFNQSLYPTLNSIRMEIVPNMISAPLVASSVFHSAPPVYSQGEENSANTSAPGTNMSDFDKSSDTELTLEDLLVECRQELEAQQLKLEEAFMAHYNVMSRE